MKKTFALILCLVLALALVACGSPSSSVSQQSSSLPDSSTPDSSASTPDSSTPDSSLADSSTPASSNTGAPTGELSDDLADFQILLDGDVFTVPSTFQDFIDKGWTPEKDLETMELEDRQGTTTRMTKGESYFSVSFANTSGGKQMAIDSTVYKISVVSTVNYGPKVDMTLPGGITYEATLEDIKAAYGEPGNEHESEDFTNLTYHQVGGYHSIQLTVYHEGGLQQIELNRLEIK